MSIDVCVQADNHTKHSENERLAHKNTLQSSKLKNATDENDRAQNKLLQSLREVTRSAAPHSLHLIACEQVTMLQRYVDLANLHLLNMQN